MKSECVAIGRVSVPRFSGVRVQMMPFHVDNPLSAGLCEWEPLLALVASVSGEHGVGFLTIDQSIVQAGEHHRRPGLHVDCGSKVYAHGGSPPRPGHGGSPPAPSPSHGASGGRGGMYVLASHLGSRGWIGELDATQGEEGNCEHLRDMLAKLCPVTLEPRTLYWCNSTFIHETLPASHMQLRTFARVSMPSAAPWHSNYTVNPLGLTPGGPIAPPRKEMCYRAA